MTRWKTPLTTTHQEKCLLEVAWELFPEIYQSYKTRAPPGGGGIYCEAPMRVFFPSLLRFVIYIPGGAKNKRFTPGVWARVGFIIIFSKYHEGGRAFAWAETGLFY